MKDATTDLSVGSTMCGGRPIPPGQIAQVLIQEFSQRSFTGQLVHTANALDPAARTLLTEVQLSNRDVTLLPGMYAQVKFVITRANPPWVIPANTRVIRPGGPQGAIVGDDQKVHYQKVVISWDYRTEIEISSSLTGAEGLIPNPDDRAERAPVEAIADLQ